jgi:hypothetical protein
LPREIGNLQKLRTLNIKYTGIEELPREIGSLQQLETLDIRDSYIKELPKEMWSLQQLNSLHDRYTDHTAAEGDRETAEFGAPTHGSYRGGEDS